MRCHYKHGPQSAPARWYLLVMSRSARLPESAIAVCGTHLGLGAQGSLAVAGAGRYVRIKALRKEKAA